MRETRLVFARDARAHLRGFLYWTVPMAILLVMVIAIQPSMAQKGSALDLKLQLLPDSIKKVFGIGALDFTRPAGYLAVNFTAVTITSVLFPALLGANLVAKEEALRTAELLFAQPVSRVRVLLGKAAALALHLLAFQIVLAAIALVGLALVVQGPAQTAQVLALFAGTTALAVCMGGLGMLVATLVPRPRLAANAALGLALGGYFANVIAMISPSVEWLGRVSPFTYVAPTRILAHGGLEPLPALALVAVGIAAAAAAIARYSRRDILA